MTGFLRRTAIDGGSAIIVNQQTKQREKDHD